MREYFWLAVYQFVSWIFKGLLGPYISFSEGPPLFSRAEGPRALLIWNTALDFVLLYLKAEPQLYQLKCMAV